MSMFDRQYLAEFVAAFALIFIGAGSVIASSLPGGPDIVGIALAHGLVLMCMVYAVGHISGAHVNPAVTIAMLATKNITRDKAIGYIISQLAGATFGGLLLAIIFSGIAPEAAHLGTPALGLGIGEFRAVLVEAVLTFFLVFVVFGTAVDKRAPAGLYGLAIGLVLAFDILAGGFLTGGAMNPARAFGPALASGYWAAQWVYWVGPIIGALAAAFAYT
ncbi:MAG: MIP family channel protein, partial [Candidatus Aenigmarchaeota archaeon]|nr:MIP family channel protein [Candidatus Aenigmarchaeota archaeon]